MVNATRAHPLSLSLCCAFLLHAGIVCMLTFILPLVPARTTRCLSSSGQSTHPSEVLVTSVFARAHDGFVFFVSVFALTGSTVERT